MTARDDFEALIKNCYAARKRGDVESLVALCTDDIHFQLSGEPSARSVAMMCRGRTDFRQGLSALIDAFEFLEYEIVASVIEGDSAAVRAHVRARNTTSGAILDTVVADFIDRKDGRISSFIQFVDTVRAAQLAGLL